MDFLLLLCSGLELRVVLGDQLAVDTGQLLYRERGEEFPAEVQGVLDGAVLIVALPDKAVLEEVRELEEEAVTLGERILADDSHEAAEVVPFCIACVHLVGDLL